jgi:hypothetical protein
MISDIPIINNTIQNIALDLIALQKKFMKINNTGELVMASEILRTKLQSAGINVQSKRYFTNTISGLLLHKNYKGSYDYKFDGCNSRQRAFVFATNTIPTTAESLCSLLQLGHASDAKQNQVNIFYHF